MAFVQRAITLVFQFGSAKYISYSNIGVSQANLISNNLTVAGNGSDKLTITGARVKCRITNNGGPSTSDAHIVVYGLTQQHLSDLSALNSVFMIAKQNTVTVLVNDITNPQAAPTTVFQGQIKLSQTDLTSQPDSVLTIVAHAGLWEALKPAPSVSFAGLQTDVAQIIGNIVAQQMPTWVFENSLTVPITIPRPHLSGSIRDQIMQVRDAAFINIAFERNIVAIWDRQGYRTQLSTTAEISPELGMVGYPSYSEVGLHVKTLFNPNILQGGLVSVTSDLPYASGEFGTWSIIHELESQVPDGAWFTEFDANRYDVLS